jgi:hypothetical protein
MVIHIRRVNGGKDRDVPLSPTMPETLREHLALPEAGNVQVWGMPVSADPQSCNCLSYPEPRRRTIIAASKRPHDRQHDAAVPNHRNAGPGRDG